MLESSDAMGRNGMDDDVPAPETEPASDEPEREMRSADIPRARIGRPPRLTPALQEKLVAAVRVVGWINPAARQCGIPEPVVREWIARGRGQHSRPWTPEYAAFAAAIDAAQADWEAGKLALIDTAARTKVDCWTAAAWALERHTPERYGRRDRIDVSGTVTLVEVRALLIAVVRLVERYVPQERRAAELADLAAVAGELAGEVAHGVAAPPALARGG
jgi:hypothetical protein